jgi:hypothetical protein
MFIYPKKLYDDIIYALQEQIREDDRLERCAIREAEDMYKQHLELEKNNSIGLIVPRPRVFGIIQYFPFLSAFTDNYQEFRNNKYKELIRNN